MANTKASPGTRQIDFENDDEVERSQGSAVRNALREHKRKGQSVVIWQDGKIVTLAPEDIPVEISESE
jgi:hypothetical protein